MPTLAEVLRQTGYAQDGTLAAPASTEPTMTSILQKHIASLPQKFNENQAEQMAMLQRAFPDNTLKNADPKAMAELAMQVPFNALTAYHGTPHKILGKFDINKVGTGEGAQSYGHGMYFAEAPAVADQYRKDLSAIVNYDQNTKKFQVLDRDRKVLGEYDNMLKAGQEADKAGNLYKVDIPDEYIPNMLDWDKPFKDQTSSVQAAIKQLEPKIRQINPNLKVENLNGKGIYHAYQQYRGNQPDFASEGMNELGIKGIRYLDQGSRNPGFSSLTPTQLQSRIESLQTDINSGGGNQAKMKDQLKALQNEMDSYKNMTSNFVVFDPSTVKILEENSKPLTRKELIEQQVNKVLE